MKQEISDDPPELTQRRCGSGGLLDNAAVDLEWLASLAEEFNVVCENGGSDKDDKDEEEEQEGERAGEIEERGGDGESKGEQRNV